MKKLHTNLGGGVKIVCAYFGVKEVSVEAQPKNGPSPETWHSDHTAGYRSQAVGSCE